MPRDNAFTVSLMLDMEVLEEIMTEFPTLNGDNGYIHINDVRKALDITGFHIAGFELRDLLEKELPGVETVTAEQLVLIHARVKELKDIGRTFRKDKILTKNEQLEVQEIKSDAQHTDTRHEAKHTYSPDEERAFADWLNRRLKDDSDCKPYLPVVPTSDDLYEKLKDGLILCKLINKSVSDTIDERILYKGKQLTSPFKQNANRMLAVNSAEAIGCCVVNVGPGDIAEGRKHLILGLLWQIIRIGLLSEVNLAHKTELAALLRPGETLDDLRQLTPEEILNRWVNYHLEKAGVSKRINNFKEDIMDSEAYAYLLQQIAPLETRSLLTPVTTILSSNDNLQRAHAVLRNAGHLDAAVFLQASDISNVKEKGKNRDKLNLAFVANLFNLYPALELPTDTPVETQEIEETLEEKTYRNWMNSMGVSPYVKDLYSDLKNGLVFLQLFDVLKPGLVAWKKVVRNFNPKKKLFEIQDNCKFVVDAAQSFGLKVGPMLSGENIREGDRKLVLGLCFQMMQAYTLKLLTNLRGGQIVTEKDIVAWANDKLASAGKTTKITSLRDPIIAHSKVIVDLIDALQPNSVDYSLVLASDEIDAKTQNAKFAISLARRIGARIYALPEHLVQLNKNMITTVFICLMVLDYQLKSHSGGDQNYEVSTAVGAKDEANVAVQSTITKPEIASKLNVAQTPMTGKEEMLEIPSKHKARIEIISGVPTEAELKIQNTEEGETEEVQPATETKVETDFDHTLSTNHQINTENVTVDNLETTEKTIPGNEKSEEPPTSCQQEIRQSRDATEASYQAETETLDTKTEELKR